MTDSAGVRAPSVLVVDDEAAFNGHETLEAVERASYDLIVLDLRMPVTDGFTFLTLASYRWPTPRSRVLLLTGDLSPIAESIARFHDRHRPLRKPCASSEVVRAAREFFDMPAG
ncbi:MAG: response regulator [Planctomycetota bacterium]